MTAFEQYFNPGVFELRANNAAISPFLTDEPPKKYFYQTEQGKRELIREHLGDPFEHYNGNYLYKGTWYPYATKNDRRRKRKQMEDETKKINDALEKFPDVFEAIDYLKRTTFVK